MRVLLPWSTCPVSTINTFMFLQHTHTHTHYTGLRTDDDKIGHALHSALLKLFHHIQILALESGRFIDAQLLHWLC